MDIILRYRKVFVVTKDTKIQTTYTLSKMIDLLNGFDFIQVHQSYLVNMLFIVEISNKSIKLDNEEIIPIGFKFYKPLMFIIQYVSK